MLQELLERFRDHPRVVEIVQLLGNQRKSRVLLQGLSGSCASFVLAGVQKRMPSQILWIESEKEDAAYAENDLSALLPERQVHLFLDSFKSPRNFERLATGNVLQRTEMINRLTGKQKQQDIIVTYPEALFEKVVAPEVIRESRLEVEKGQQLDLDFFIEVLVEYGFTHADFVYEPGQFSVRGCIVDVFSYANEWPYRIELNDVVVDSIRTFDPGTQLSKSRLSRFAIVPNINTKFKQSQKVSLFQILQEDAWIIVSDLHHLIDRLQQCFEAAEKISRTVHLLEEEELKAFFDDRAFIYPREILENLLNHNLVFLKKPDPLVDNYQTVAFQTKPQPSFNKNFQLLIQDLDRRSAEGYTNFLFSDNPKQIERFYGIFQDMRAQVQFHPLVHAIHEGFVEEDLQVSLYTDHQIFQRFHSYKLKHGFSKDQAISFRMLKDLQPGDFVTHIDHGIGRYSGLEKININGHIQESVRLIYKNNDILYVSINSLHKISKYSGKEGTEPVLAKLGSEVWKNLKQKTKRRLKDIAGELIQLYAKRKAAKGYAFPPDSYLQNELEASFIFEDTPDQIKVTDEVKSDMQRPFPMDRLVCGDVGFGKTEIAIRAAFKAVLAGKQVAVLVPTTILALQHFKTFSDRLKEFGCRVDYINRFRSAKERTEIRKDLEEGKIDIIIGTHALLSKEFVIKKLGLLVIDEEQKFGVSDKEKLRKIMASVDTLTLTATPIPRTLQFSLLAARDLSVIRTPPPNRQPIHTEIRVFSEDLIKDAIYYEVQRGGQIFFVQNRVKSLPEMIALLKRLCPDIDIGMAHGQMDPEKLEDTLLQFINRQYDVLVCTNIIETGLDIPNANTIIINNAHQFGLSDLHQLRGRVGRSDRKAFCYLFCPPMSVLTQDARMRLRTIEEFSDLGSGFQVSMRDLDIRGAGNLLGAEQSGFINEIGFDTYQKILDEAIRELKETDFKDLFAEELAGDREFVREITIETDTEMHIPDQYVSNIQERLSLYTELDAIDTEEGLQAFASTLEDRFGPIPWQVRELMQGLRLRWLCRKLGFERIVLKDRSLKAFFLSNPQSPFFESDLFRSVLQFISQKGKSRHVHLKQGIRHLMMVADKIGELSTACSFLEEILQVVSNHLPQEDPKIKSS